MGKKKLSQNIVILLSQNIVILLYNNILNSDITVLIYMKIFYGNVVIL